MVQLCVLIELRKTQKGSAFRVAGGKNNATNPSLQKSAGTHKAGFKCDIKSAVAESPALPFAASQVQRLHLCMAQAGLFLFAKIQAFCHNIAVFINNNRAHRYVASSFAQSGQFQRQPHEAQIGPILV